MSVRGESVSWSGSTLFNPNSNNMHKHDEIDRDYSQMIAKSKIWILLYKNFVVSHSAPLEDEFKLRVLIYVGFTIYLMLFP